MAFVEDLGDFINPDTPGYVVAQILTNNVPGIFNNDYAQGVGGVGFESSEPELHCKDLDVVSVVHGTVVAIGATNYRVAEINPDGTGISVLRLKK